MNGGFIMSEQNSNITQIPPAGKHRCPVCGQYEFPNRNSFDICSICGWQDDVIQEMYPDETAGANGKSLNSYKAAFDSGWRPDWLDDDDDDEDNGIDISLDDFNGSADDTGTAEEDSEDENEDEDASLFVKIVFSKKASRVIKTVALAGLAAFGIRLWKRRRP